MCAQLMACATNVALLNRREMIHRYFLLTIYIFSDVLKSDLFVSLVTYICATNRSNACANYVSQQERARHWDERHFAIMLSTQIPR